jgi:aspartyl-tRNA(Asn)/glutamyl-tRNA(Gln) amidotransferase subunit B
VQTALLAELNRQGQGIAACRVRPEDLAALVRLIDDGTISGKIAKEVFAKMVESGEAPRSIVEREGLLQVSDAGAIEAAAREVLAKNPGAAQKYAAGQTQLIGFFVGQVMKATGGKANPQLVNSILRRLLGDGAGTGGAGTGGAGTGGAGGAGAAGTGGA